MARAHAKLVQILEESDPDDTKYDEKGRMVRLGTSKRDRAAIVKDTISSVKLLGEISRDATEQHIAVTRLIHGIFNPGAGKSDTAGAVPLEDLTTLKATVEHNVCPPTPTPSSTPAPENVQSSSDPASPTSGDSQD